VGLLLLLGLRLAVVQVEGSSGCPSPSEVTAALAPFSIESDDVARVDPAPNGAGGIEIVLTDRAGTLKKTRRIPTAACADLAQAAAVVIAVWESELKEARLQPVRLPPPRRTDALSARQVTLELAPAFAAVLTGSSFAPGGELAGAVVARRRPIGARAAFVGSGTRDATFPPGHASYTRYHLSLGPMLRFRPSRLLIDLHALVALGVVTLRGVGYQTNQTATDFDPGLGGGIRLGVRLGRYAAPFIGAEVVGWPRRQLFQIAGVSGAGELPRWDLILTAGVALGTLL
jgi:hypothetical protein